MHDGGRLLMAKPLLTSIRTCRVNVSAVYIGIPSLALQIVNGAQHL